VLHGRPVTPVIAHFVGHGVRRYEYQREALRLQVAVRGFSFPHHHDSIIRLSAYGRWFHRVGFAEYGASMADRLERTLPVRSHTTRWSK
jgi:hypothetical protein